MAGQKEDCNEKHWSTAEVDVLGTIEASVQRCKLSAFEILSRERYRSVSGFKLEEQETRGIVAGSTH